MFSFKLTSNHFRNSSLGPFNKEYNSSYLSNNKTKLQLPLQMPSPSFNINHHIQRSSKIIFDNLFLASNSVKTPNHNKLNYQVALSNNSASLTNLQINNNKNKFNNALYKQREQFPLIKANKLVNENLLEQKVKNNIYKRGNHSQDSASFKNKQYQSCNNIRSSFRKNKLNEISYRDNNKKDYLEKERIIVKDNKDELMKKKDKLMIGGGGDDINDSFYKEVQELLINVNSKNSNKTKDIKECKENIIRPVSNEVKKWNDIKRPETSYGDLNMRNSNLNTVLKSAKYRNNNHFMETNKLNILK